MSGVPPNAKFAPSTCSKQATLAASPDGNSPGGSAFQNGIVNPQASAEWNRMIIAKSTDGLPFDMSVTWTSGMGLGGSIKITGVGGIARIALSAISLNVAIANWAQSANRVIVSVGDIDSPLSEQNLPLAMRNQGIAALGGGWTVSVPPFAKQLVCKASSNAQLANIELDFQDDTGTTVFKCAANATEIVPGPATRVVITNNDAAVVNSLMLLWALSL